MYENFVSSSKTFFPPLLFCANNINRFIELPDSLNQKWRHGEFHVTENTEKCILLGGIYAKAGSLLAAYNLVSSFS